MLYNLLFQFHTQVPVLNVIQYITFRTAAASLTALVISLLLGPWLIRKLREFQIGQIIRHEGPASHAPKAGTPTMGGLLILTASIVPTLLWADLLNSYIWIAVLSTAAFGAIGFTDDYLKIVRRSHHGLLAALQDPRPGRRRPAGRRDADLPGELPPAASLQHAADFPVLQIADSRPGLGLRVRLRLSCSSARRTR